MATANRQCGAPHVLASAAFPQGERAFHALDDHARIHDSRWIELPLRRGERLAEQRGSLLPVPRHVIATDRVVMRDRSAEAMERFRSRRFHFVPVL